MPEVSPSDALGSAARTTLVAAPPLIVIAGATATGKTGLSLGLAEAIGNAQIICADSRQVFRGMDIGTAKADAQMRRRVPHHGLDLVDPDAAFTVADYVCHAHAALADIAASGGTAILVGGSGLYLRAVARGVPVGETGHDPAERGRLEQRLNLEGLPALVDQLRRTAPGVAAATDLANPRRVVRALERVAEKGDRPPPAPRGYPGPVLWLGLDAEPAEHRAAITSRAAGQFAGGLLEEAAALGERYGTTPVPFSAMSYREAFKVLGQHLSIHEAIEQTARRTWAYARRQRTWFRREPDITWLRGFDQRSVATAVEAARPFLDGVLPSGLGEP